MDKRFWGIVAAIVIVLGLVFFITNKQDASAPSSSVSATNHIEGGGSSGVTLTEYGDFQCPACGQYYPLVEQVVATYKDQIHFQFRNFPLYQIHQNAIAGSRAAEAADMQGKFWDMYHKLYENQNDWSGSSNPTNLFKQYAESLGMDVAKFETDFKSATVNNRVQADLKEGNRLEITSTPTFFIDGKKISTPTSVEAFNKVIETAITQKTGKAPTTTQTQTESSAETPTDSAQ